MLLAHPSVKADVMLRPISLVVVKFACWTGVVIELPENPPD